MHLLTTLLGLALVSSPTRPPSGQPAPMVPGDYTPAGPANVVSWQLKRLAPPSPLYVTRDDLILATAASSQTAEVVTVSYRRLDAHDGRVHLEQFTIKPGSNRAVVTAKQPLAEGFILSISCQAAVATTRGQTFVRLAIGNTALGGAQPAYMLLADYITTAMGPGFPNGRILSPVEGPGFVTNRSIGLQPAGTEWVFFVPANTRWRFMGARAFFTTSATVVDRAPTLEIQLGNQGVFRSPAAASTPANTLAVYSWGPGVAFGTDINPDRSAPTPENLIIGGPGTSSVNSNTGNLDAGDQWSSIAIAVEEWLDNV
jgi:hypothetical protein